MVSSAVIRKDGFCSIVKSTRQIIIMEGEKAELKSILRGLLISSPRQMTIRDLQNDFARQEGREFPFHKFGFRNFIDYLRTIKDTVVLSGSQPIYVSPVVKASTAHVNDMVLRQKNSAPKKASLKSLDKSRRRGWVPIVIPPDPPKALPTLLSIRIPSRNKAITFPSSSFNEPGQVEADTQHKVINGPSSSHTEDSSKNVTIKSDAVYFLQEHKIGTKSEQFKGLHELAESGNSSSDKKSENWQDISRVSNDEMKDNIEEWFHAETPQTLPHSVLSTEVKNEQTKTENGSVTCENVTNTVSVDDTCKFKENKQSEISCEKNSFSAEQQEICSELGTFTSLSPALSCERNSAITSDESVQNRLLSDKTVLNMKNLMKQNPQGLWASEFPAIYKECYGVSLDYHLSGYMSMAVVAAAYPDVFISLRRSSADFLLLDASKPLPKHYAQSSNTSSYGVVTEGLKNNIECLLAAFPSGLPTNNFKDMYKAYFTEDLNEKDLGFLNIDELLQNLHEEFVIRLRRVGKSTLIYPARNTHRPLQEPPLCSFTTDDACTTTDILYPPEVLDPNDTIPRIPFPNHPKGVPVLVSDVMTPSNFHMILSENNDRLESLMDELQVFYTTDGGKYKMPDSAIRKGALCVARYKNRDWHRAKIYSTNCGMRKVKVTFIDYGTIDTVDADELRYMHSDFAKHPIQAIPACLANVEPKNGTEWDRKASDFLLKMVKEKILMAIMNQISEEQVVSVGLVDTSTVNDIHINDELVYKGHAIFSHNSLSADTSTSETEQKIIQSGELKSNGLDMNEWSQEEKTQSFQKITKIGEMSFLPHSGTRPEADMWTPPVDDKKDAINVTSDLNPHVRSFFHSAAKNCSSDLLAGNSIGTKTSPSGPCDKISPLCSYDHKSSASDLLSKANITKVWGTPLVMSGPLSTSTATSNETDMSLKLKEIPDTWNVSPNNVGPSYDSPVRETGFSETASAVFLNDQVQNSLSSKAKDSSPQSSLFQSSDPILVSKNPYSSREPSRNGNTPSVQSEGCAPNMWNLGNIAVNASWPPPGNNPAIYNPSTPMWQQQSVWYQPLQSIPQFALNTFGGLPGAPPPGFSSIQNPFVTYSTSPFPTLDPQLPLLNNPFVYQQRNKSWTPAISGLNSSTACRSSSSPTGFSSSRCSSANEVVRSTPEISEISHISKKHSTMLKKFKTVDKNPKHVLDSDVQTREHSSAVCHVENLNMQPVVCNQDIQNSIANREQPDAKASVGNIMVANSVTDNENNDTWKSSDPQKVLANQGQLLDSSALTQRSSDTVKNKEQETVFSESSQHKSNVGVSVGTVKSDSATDRGFKHKINSVDSNFQSTAFNISVNVFDAASCDSSVVQKKQPNRVCIQNGATTDLSDNFKEDISKKIEKLEIDSARVSSDLSKMAYHLLVTNSSENKKLDLQKFIHMENSSKAKDQENSKALSHEDTGVIALEDTAASEGKKIPLRCIRKTLLAGKVLTLINYNQQPYFCTDEFVRSFSKFSGRHVLLKILDTHGLKLPFFEVNRSDNWEMFEMLDNCELNTRSRKPNGQIHDILHMVPLSAAANILNILKISDAAIYAGVDKEIQNFNPEDDYWYEN